MRLLLIVAAALLAGCAPKPAPQELQKPDPTQAEWYPQSVEQLTALTREAQGLFQSGKVEQAAALVKRALSLSSRLLAVPQPTLAATEAASDLDELHGRMLLADRQYGWARLLFQKNLARWKNWKPETAETARRKKLALSGIAECDRRMAQ